MWRKSLTIPMSLMVLFIGGALALAACPSTDVTGDCKVDGDDFDVIAGQWLAGYDMDDLIDMSVEWLTEGISRDPCNLHWVTISDPGVAGHEAFNGQMSKYQTTNAQFCAYLNAALATTDITVAGNIVYGASGSNSGDDFVGVAYFETHAADLSSQITYTGGVFSVRLRQDIHENDVDVNDHPVSEVTWQGAAAFCSYYGYRLPTEWEWQAVADFDGSYNYGCGPTIDLTTANYLGNNPLELGTPGTSPVDYYPSYGYGMNDMAGNIWEWTDSCYYPNCGNNYMVLRGGAWYMSAVNCEVDRRHTNLPFAEYFHFGFRACR